MRSSVVLLSTWVWLHLLCSPLFAASFAGDWSGSFATEQYPAKPVHLLSEVTETGFKGTYVLESTDHLFAGTFTTTEDSELLFTISLYQTTESGCGGTYTGTGAFSSDNDIVFTFSGSDCLGSHDEGVLTLRRNLPVDGLQEASLTFTDNGFSFEFDSTRTTCSATASFIALNQLGYSINDLVIDNFVITEDSASRDIESDLNLTSSTSLNVSLVLDTSSSVESSGLVDQQLDIAQGLVDFLSNRAEFSYYTYANTVKTVTDLSGVSFDEQLRLTSLYDAVYQAIEDSATADKNAVLFIITGGNDNHSEHSLAEVLDFAAANNVLAYTVTLLGGIVPELDPITVRGIAIPSLSYSEVSAAFAEIAAFRRSVYTLSYESPSRTGQHKLGMTTQVGTVTSKSVESIFTVADSSCSGISALSPPVLSSVADGSSVTLSWSDVEGATGYYLYYAPYPEGSPINFINAGATISQSYVLQSGDAYFVAAKAYSNTDLSDYSNVEQIIIP